ncbi:hypothetical protein HMPREF1870_00786 [Bacteroidales bacterium KA00344]|nr:hypothetical protein HMPREF1870_00786 [Bacteroidales bacterium KA00344]
MSNNKNEILSNSHELYRQILVFLEQFYQSFGKKRMDCRPRMVMDKTDKKTM